MREDVTTVKREDEGIILTRVMTRKLDNDALMHELGNISREKETYLRELRRFKEKYDMAIELENEIKTTLAEIEEDKGKTSDVLDDIGNIIE